MFKVGVVLVALLLTLNIFRIFVLVFLLLELLIYERNFFKGIVKITFRHVHKNF